MFDQHLSMAHPAPASRDALASLQRSRRISWPAFGLSLASAATGLFIAAHYPLSPALALSAFLAVGIAFWSWPAIWLVAVPALLPVIDLAPWTGWITFEEFDLLVLAAASAGYARLALPRGNTSAPASPGQSSNAAALVWFMVALFVVSQAAAVARGFADAGGFAFSWFQGYREPMNSVRLAKPLAEALLLFPLWLAANKAQANKASANLSLGLMLGLLGASLAAGWERLAFTDLLNFSADYRTTALFWEMHVGGAALDGFLALTMPFAVREMLVARKPWRWILAAMVTGVGTYACVTTFSRGVYLGVPVGLFLLIGLHAAQQPRAGVSTQAEQRGAAWARVLLVGGFAFAALWMFPTSGYRGMLALAGATFVLLPMAAVLQRRPRVELLLGAGLGAVLSLLAWAASSMLPKGPYFVFAIAVLLALGLLIWRALAMSRARWIAPALLSVYLCIVTCVVLVAAYWGGEAAFQRALPATALLLAACLAGALRVVPWPPEPRWQGNTFAAMLVTGALVATFGGGAYMGERFSTSTSDMDVRLLHWQRSLAMLVSPGDWLFGKGMGRYVENYALASPEGEQPGDYRVQVDTAGNLSLMLDAGTHIMGGGELLQIAQRVDTPTNPVTVSFDARGSGAVELYAGVCMKHLLYPAACIESQVKVDAKPSTWTHVQTRLKGNQLSSGDWYAPQQAVFALAIATGGARVQVDNVSLRGNDGRELLVNGDFGSDMARWFFSSDRSHLPWHIKSMALNVLFEQGLVGLLLLVALVGGALWRVVAGRARRHVLAPAVAGALLGFGVVGLFDSLLDVPRVAFLFYSLVLLGMTLRAPAVLATQVNSADAASSGRAVQ